MTPAGDSVFGVDDPTGETVDTQSGLGEWDYRLSTSTKVVTHDDHTIGTVHGVGINPDASRGQSPWQRDACTAAITRSRSPTSTRRTRDRFCSI
jgi:hypothetical protein